MLPKSPYLQSLAGGLGVGAKQVRVKPTPRLRGLGTPPASSQAPQSCAFQAPSITLGFRAAVDLLSPLALLCFSAVARGPDPPTGVSKERAPS